jgi:hypothetical protein
VGVAAGVAVGAAVGSAVAFCVGDGDGDGSLLLPPPQAVKPNAKASINTAVRIFQFRFIHVLLFSYIFFFSFLQGYIFVALTTKTQYTVGR